VAVNLLADFEGVLGTVSFFHSRCLDHPASANKEKAPCGGAARGLRFAQVRSHCRWGIGSHNYATQFAGPPAQRSVSECLRKCPLVEVARSWAAAIG
jgi:hypothetical protein